MMKYICNSISKLLTVSIIMLLTTSCDVMFLALGMLGAMYDTTYSSPTYISNPYVTTSSTTTSSSSYDNTHWEEYYSRNYQRCIENFQMNYKSYLGTSNSVHKGVYVGRMVDNQNEMKSLRKEAATKGVIIPISTFETMSW